MLSASRTRNRSAGVESGTRLLAGKRGGMKYLEKRREGSAVLVVVACV
jgi:hypothetical protein